MASPGRIDHLGLVRPRRRSRTMKEPPRGKGSFRDDRGRSRRAAAEAARHRQELRPGPGARRRRPRRPRRPGHRAGRRQRRRQVGAHQVHRRDPQPDGGQILWEGQPVHIRTPRDAAALGIETVHQDLALCDNLDIVQNMFLGRELVRHFVLDEEEMEKAAGETLSGLAVTTVRSIRQLVASLSGGQRQSVAIAKAVLWNSKLVIMDEPTAALGVAQTAMVLELVRRLADRGLAVIIISHNMNDVFEVADRIAVLRLGRMVAVQTGRRDGQPDRRRPDDDRRVEPRRRIERTADRQGCPVTDEDRRQSPIARAAARDRARHRDCGRAGRTRDRARDHGRHARRVRARRREPRACRARAACCRWSPACCSSRSCSSRSTRTSSPPGTSSTC